MTKDDLETVEGRAYARAGVLGNPSDGYGGKAIAVSVYDFAAIVRIEPADHLRIITGRNAAHEFESLRDLDEFYKAQDCDGGARLLGAAIARFLSFATEVSRLPAADARLRFSMAFETTIPRQVGLAGSSAIIIAALRALSAWFNTQLPRFVLAELALKAELEDLGNAAGPMDRVIQAYEGLMAMELREPRAESGYTRLEIKQMPPLAVAWVPGGGEVSGRAHGDLRARWLAGDSEVWDTVKELRSVVDRGVVCLNDRDFDTFRALIDRNFELRTLIYDVSEHDLSMIAIAREAGAAAKLCGSGGAVLVVPADAGDLKSIEGLYRDRGYEFILPQLKPAAGAPK